MKRYQIIKQTEDIAKSYPYSSQKSEVLKRRFIYLSRTFGLIDFHSAEKSVVYKFPLKITHDAILLARYVLKSHQYIYLNLSELREM